MKSPQASPPWPTWQAGPHGLSHPFLCWQARGGVRQQDGQRQVALPDLVVTQTQYLQTPEAQEAMWDSLQLVVIHEQLVQGGT